MAGRRAGWLVGGIGVFATLGVLSGLVRAPESPEAFVDRWLQSVAGEGAADRGWSQLSDHVRARLGSDGAYVADASEVDWSGFRWHLAESYAVESWLWTVAVEVDGGLAAVPDFLRIEQLVGPSCADAASPGIRLMVARDGLSGPWTLGPGALTGTSERALLLGRCS